MTDGQLCRPVARRKRQVQRQIDHAVLGAVTRARVALAPRRSDAVDVLAADGGGSGVLVRAVTLRASGGCGRRCQAAALPARATPSSRSNPDAAATTDYWTSTLLAPIPESPRESTSVRGGCHSVRHSVRHSRRRPGRRGGAGRARAPGPGPHASTPARAWVQMAVRCPGRSRGSGAQTRPRRWSTAG